MGQRTGPLADFSFFFVTCLTCSTAQADRCFHGRIGKTQRNSRHEVLVAAVDRQPQPAGRRLSARVAPGEIHSGAGRPAAGCGSAATSSRRPTGSLRSPLVLPDVHVGETSPTGAAADAKVARASRSGAPRSAAASLSRDRSNRSFQKSQTT